MRIDKYLWAVRLFKTRSIASEAVKAGKVTMGRQEVKSSREVKVGDVFEVKQTPIWRVFRVKELLPNRVGPKLVATYMEEITPQEELDKYETFKQAASLDRPRGAGRPTKKERRELDELFTGGLDDDWPY